MIQHLLLLVDGNLNERGVQERFFEAEGFAVATAATVEEALDKVAEGPLPILAISAVQLPGPDGFALCECLRREEATREMPVILLCEQLLSAQTPVDQILVKQKLKHLGIALEDYLPKSADHAALLDRVVFHITRIGRAQLTQAILEGATHVGRLEYLGVLELAQLFETSGLSGKVFFEMSGERAQLFFREGQLIDARFGRLSEQKAFLRLLSATEGDFEIAFGEPGRPARIEMPMRELIAEGQKRRNEIHWISTQLPPPDTALAFNFELLSERLSEIPDEENRLLRLFDGRRTLREVLAATDFDELEALGIIGNLFFDGLLVNAAAADVLPALQLRDESPALAGARPPAPAEETPQPERAGEVPMGQAPAADSGSAHQATPAELLFFEEPDGGPAAGQAPGRGARPHLCAQGCPTSAEGVQIGGAAAEPARTEAPDSDGGDVSAPGEAPIAAAMAAAIPEALAAARPNGEAGGSFAAGARASEASAGQATPTGDDAGSCVPAAAVPADTDPAIAAMSDQELMAQLRPSRRIPLAIAGGVALIGLGVFAGNLLSNSAQTPAHAPAPAAAPTAAAPRPIPDALPAAPAPLVASAPAAQAEAEGQASPGAVLADAPEAPAAEASAAAPSTAAPATAPDAPPAAGEVLPPAALPAGEAPAPLRGAVALAAATAAGDQAAPPAPVPAKTSRANAAAAQQGDLAQVSAPEAAANSSGGGAAAAGADVEALIARGRALLDAERFSAAAKLFREALQKRPEDQRALSGLGRALIDKNPNQAIRHLNRALKLNPRDALAWHDLGVAYQFSTPERPREALHAYEQFLKHAPNSKKPNAREIRVIVKTLREELGD